MIIDAHNHVEWHGYTADDLVRNMDECGIDKAWVCTWECPEREIAMEHYAEVFAPARTGMPLADVVAAAREYPDRFVPFYAPDPRDPKVLQKLRSAVALYGIRGYGELKVRITADDPDALVVYRACGEMGLPVVIHIDITFPVGGVPRPGQTWYCHDIGRLENTLRLCPETAFIGHAPGFWREISAETAVEEAYPGGAVKPGGRLPLLLDRYPNLYCDLSAGSGYNAVDRDREHGRDFLIKHQDRILYGRDNNDNRHQELLRSLELPGDTLEKILGGNALKLVPLPEEGASVA